MAWPSNNPISRELNERWKESSSLWQQWQQQADIDIKMVSGQQDCARNSSGFGGANYRNQTQLQFNKILRVCNMIEGFQRDNRLASIISASDNDPDMGETAEQRSEILSWNMRQDQTYEKISDSFSGSVNCGINLMQVWMDFREDPENGQICTSRIPYNAFLMDPYWTDPTLKTDCDWIWTRKYLTKTQVKSLYPKVAEQFPRIETSYAAKDGKFPFMAQNWFQGQFNLFAYDEYWKKDYKKVRKILDRATGEVAPWNGTREQFQLLRRYNPNVELISATVPTIKMYVLVNNELVYEEQSPYGLDRFPFVPFVCYHFPEIQNYAYRHRGIPRNIRDAQIELNRRRNRLLDIMDAQVQSGLMVKENALVNPEDAFMQGPGKVLYFKQSANLASDVAPIPPPPVAQGWMELIQTIEKEIMDIVGPEELFAQNMGAKEMTGVLMKLKMGAGLTGLRNIFDRLNQSQMLLGEIFDEMVVNNFSEGKVAQILGKAPSQHFFDKTFTKYHCSVEEAELTSSQRQLQFLQAIQMQQMGIQIPSKYLLEKSSLQDKKGLIETIEQQEQEAAQMQQAQAMAELEQAQVLSRSIEAKAQNDYASAEEKKARVIMDIAKAQEESGQALQNRAMANLDNAKALKELEEVDENRLIKLSDFILSVQERQQQMEHAEDQAMMMEAEAVKAPVERSEQESRVKKSSLSEAIA